MYIIIQKIWQAFRQFYAPPKYTPPPPKFDAGPNGDRLDPAKHKESVIQRFIREADPEEVQDWLNYYNYKGRKIYPEILYAALGKISSADDDFYLNQLADMDAEEAKEFFQEEKKAGTYFSDKVYRAIQAKIKG